VFYQAAPVPFDADAVRNGQEVATQIALTLRANDLLTETRRYARKQSALLSANQAVMRSTHDSLNDVLLEISNETMRLLGAECCEIEGLTSDGLATEMLAQVAIEDWDCGLTSFGQRLELSSWPLTRRVLDEQHALRLTPVLPGLTSFERKSLFSGGTRSALVAPMIVDGASIGIITFYSRIADAFDEESLSLAKDFGSLTALAIDRARTHLALAQQASYDGLTGLLNHRALHERIDHHIAVSRRTEDPLSILMIDMNEFKNVNDVHGHLAGDAVLRETASFLKRTLRASDLVGRFGGDEFVAVLPGTDLVQAIALKERLVRQIRKVVIALPNGASVVPSVAIGYASFPGQAEDVQSLIDEADRAMYAAKYQAPSVAEIVIQPEHDEVRAIR
jgi:diguanylate cyclase (GGDEF)-like protein